MGGANVVRSSPTARSAMVSLFGKYERVLRPGANLIIPLVDHIGFVHDLREQAIQISRQAAITRDNVVLDIDAILFIQVVDPYKASYGVENLRSAIMNLAQTTMRSEIGKLSLDRTFEERETLNQHIVKIISPEAAAWGVRCLRYEIRDIEPSPNIKHSMVLQAESERRKRADILLSEGQRQAAINRATAERAAKGLRAEGSAEAAIRVSDASSQALRTIGEATEGPKKGRDAAGYIATEKYMKSYKSMGAQSNSLVMKTSPFDVARNVSEAFDLLNKTELEVQGQKASSAI